VSTKGSQPTGAERRLQDLGIVLPNAPHPLGAYVEAVQSGSLLFLSGMLPIKDGKPQYVGRLGKELDADAGRDALRTATLNALSAAKEHLGSLDRVSKVVRVGVYLATSGDFYNQPIVADAGSIGASPRGIRRGQDVGAVRLRSSQLTTGPAGHA
jgi:enamine deaminase RidA (YjgF/YER057c/UK114 family)